MNSTGSSGPLHLALFPKGMGGEVMQVIRDVWYDDAFIDLKLENRITALLCQKLIDAFERDGHPWIVIPELPLHDPEYGTELGRNDLSIMHRACSQRDYFTVECKRLHVRKNGRFSSLAADYVTEGLIRFATGKYGEGRLHGGMIGYVLDADMKLALKRIDEQIAKRASDLRMAEGVKVSPPSSVLPNECYSFDTVHFLDTEQFTVFHLLLCDLQLYLKRVAAKSRGSDILRRSAGNNRDPNE